MNITIVLRALLTLLRGFTITKVSIILLAPAFTRPVGIGIAAFIVRVLALRAEAEALNSAVLVRDDDDDVNCTFGREVRTKPSDILKTSAVNATSNSNRAIIQ